MKELIHCNTVRNIAPDLIQHLTLYCDKLNIAGSLRRGREMVGDIELVAIPKPALDLFGLRYIKPRSRQ
jgi:DNA polymerase/3'-5' exonuclease PolX